jgi:carboxylesterase type B
MDEPVVSGSSMLLIQMKKIFLLLLIFSGVESGSAQVNYCLTSRFDTEIFQNIVTTSNVTFGSSISSSGAPTTLTLDVYEPANDTMTERPLIVWVHGGSFVGGTKNDPDVTSLCEHFAKRGYVCASINYRLGFANYPPTKAI